MSDNPTVSVVIPNLHSPIIDKAVNSILNQTVGEKFEIIVVGKDMYNRTPAGSNIKFIQTEEITPPGVARNIGVQNSKGNIIIFMDADCIASADFLQQHLNAHEGNVAKLICGSVSFPNDQYFTLCDNLSTFHEYLPNLSPGTRKILPALNLSLKRSSWDKIDSFNSNTVAEDADFSFRAAKLNITPFFYPSALISHQPSRSTLKVIIQHAYNFGKYSIQIDPRYRANIGFGIFRVPNIIRLLSPLLAMFVILKIIFIERLPIQYWFTLPIIYLLKIGWCFGAAKGVRKCQDNE